MADANESAGPRIPKQKPSGSVQTYSEKPTRENWRPAAQNTWIRLPSGGFAPRKPRMCDQQQPVTMKPGIGTVLPPCSEIMEIAGVDADGNDTLIEVVINVAQGDPAPERLRDTNEIPSLSPGVSLATSAGVPEQVQIEVRPEQRQVAVLSGDWSFEVTVEEETGTVADESGTLAVRLVQEKTADVSGSGFQPDSRVDVWLFSDPTLLGSVTVSADGSFTTEFYLDSNYATPGEHTLQLQGVGSDGYIKAANLGVEIVQPAAMATESPSFSLLWWILVAALVLALTVIFGWARRRAIR